MNVSAEEYSHIEAVYMSSDLDKDEFCKLWVKMNHKRVSDAKAEQKKYIGNAVEVGMARVLCEALCDRLEEWRLAV